MDCKAQGLEKYFPHFLTGNNNGHMKATSHSDFFWICTIYTDPTEKCKNSFSSIHRDLVVNRISEGKVVH